MRRDRCDVLCIDVPTAETLRRARLSEQAAAGASGYARAIADPTRLTIAAVLSTADEQLCVCDLAWVVEKPQNLVSHHLRLLRAEGLVTSSRDGKMTMYALTDRGRQLLDAVLGAPVST